jgi:uncharacterized membrane protein
MVEVLMYFGVGFFVGVAVCAKILSTVYDSNSKKTGMDSKY